MCDRPLRWTRWTSWIRRLGLLAGIALGLGGLYGCQDGPHGRVPPGEVLPVGAYADGPEGLHRLWTDILSAARRDDRGRVHDLMASMRLTRPELEGLIGPLRAQELWARYQALFSSLANAGAMELVGLVYENKYEDVVVVPVEPKAAQGADKNIVEALVKPVPLYFVRVKRKQDQKGLRYDFFVYLNGHWRTGGFLGKYLEKAAAGKGVGEKGVDGGGRGA